MSRRRVYFLTALFAYSLGFFLYLAMESFYKSHFSSAATHFSMGLLAGLAFVFLLFLDKYRLPFFVKALSGAAFITLLEFFFGIYLNLYLGLGVWDYSAFAFDLLGQICPQFSLIWFVLSCGVLWIDRFLLLAVRFFVGQGGEEA